MANKISFYLLVLVLCIVAGKAWTKCCNVAHGPPQGVHPGIHHIPKIGHPNGHVIPGNPYNNHPLYAHPHGNIQGNYCDPKKCSNLQSKVLKYCGEQYFQHCGPYGKFYKGIGYKDFKKCEKYRMEYHMSCENYPKPQGFQWPPGYPGHPGFNCHHTPTTCAPSCTTTCEPSSTTTCAPSSESPETCTHHPTESCNKCTQSCIDPHAPCTLGTKRIYKCSCKAHYFK